jgi:hypothetical protein
MNTALSIVGRVLIAIARHPATHEIARHLIRTATVELVRHVRRRTARRSSSSAF